ncbi:hypothetical protein [Pedobacter ureilyticus]|uniref:Lysozyme inhibitor LprI N-terminal domain-containing protein n=1 Tax=Pedobacter ureilyticus TaxID=1393051 RepID=A0ABW9JA33_9SPHI|nr:hypothetical protein [Pedobacter helvus]
MTVQLIRWPRLLLLLMFCCSSCKVNLLPSYSQEIAAQIDTVTKDIDRLYLMILEKSSSQRVYDNYAERYIDIEVELSSLYKKNKLREKNIETTRNFEIALEKWQGYRKDHKEKKILTDGVIKLNRKFMADILFAIQLTESTKQ